MVPGESVRTPEQGSPQATESGATNLNEPQLATVPPETVIAATEAANKGKATAALTELTNPGNTETQRPINRADLTAAELSAAQKRLAEIVPRVVAPSVTIEAATLELDMLAEIADSGGSKEIPKDLATLYLEQFRTLMVQKLLTRIRAATTAEELNKLRELVERSTKQIIPSNRAQEARDEIALRMKQLEKSPQQREVEEAIKTGDRAKLTALNSQLRQPNLGIPDKTRRELLERVLAAL